MKHPTVRCETSRSPSWKRLQACKDSVWDELPHVTFISVQPISCAFRITGFRVVVRQRGRRVVHNALN